MAPSQLNPDDCSRPDTFRWTRTEATHTLQDYRDAHSSQRQFAQQTGIPRSTLQYWQQKRQHADLEPELAAFLESPVGYRFLRRLVLALHLVFHLAGNAGLRLLGDFLRLSQLDRFVAPSYGSHQALAGQLQDDLIAFAAQERSRLGQTMKPAQITVCADENFHGSDICLVAMEPLSNFLLTEVYAEQRDGPTWVATLKQAVVGLPVEFVQLTSDQAKGLLACAGDLNSQHSPDLFHVQHELTKALSLPLKRQTQAASKDLAAKEEQTRLQQQEQEKYEQGPRPAGRPPDWAADRYWCQFWQKRAAETLSACQKRQEQSRQAVRGLGDDYHPFDQTTGLPVTAEEVQRRLSQHLRGIAEVVEAAGLKERSREAVARVERWLKLLVATMAWFWTTARLRIDALALSESAEQAVYQQLLPGLYWEAAAKRSRNAEQREHRRLLAQRLLREAWSAEGPLGRLGRSEQEAVKRVAASVSGLFCRSSSCVEGRNSRLSLHHHGQGALSVKRLQALTAVHNYIVQREDGSTAAERFFGNKPADAFAWLLERMRDLPRPVKKSAKSAKQPAEGTVDRPNP